MVPASRLVVRTQQQDGFRTFLVPVDTRPLQPQVHHPADRALDRTTADRHLRRRQPPVIQPTLLTRLWPGRTVVWPASIPSWLADPGGVVHDRRWHTNLRPWRRPPWICH